MSDVPFLQNISQQLLKQNKENTQAIAITIITVCYSSIRLAHTVITQTLHLWHKR